MIYLALEEKRSEVRKHFRNMGAGTADPLLVHTAKAPRDGLAALLQLMEKHRPTLVIIDPLLRFTRVRDEKAYAELSGRVVGPARHATFWGMSRRPLQPPVAVEHVDTPDAGLDIARAYDLLMRAAGQVSEPAAAAADDDGSVGARRGKARGLR